ncbi:STAT transcription factor, all-alpha domain-containing protein [Strongyloides ratti]|uniref:STAT transcription factor, all-alpha domain-containing protein n=1 Tax=Strongyloides ratti TaxID=34506 RepID=A0A090LNY1_STRRB|nr:STAT transcription factor, all-alpha domain-containing protein [Strongyloides ratti]CEF71570.1 STAT transcription factor, all-alpha domain-containing protein [Strongyloides ratti]
MYFLSEIPYNERCDFIRIGRQMNTTKDEIIKQQDKYMNKYSEIAKKRYEEYKTSQDEKKTRDKARLDKMANKLSNEAKQLYNKIYSVINNNNVTLFQEYELCHTIINEAPFKNVVEASFLIPAKYYADEYDGHFIFHIHDEPLGCYNC